MLLKWYGHACFGMNFSGGPDVVTDPFDKSVGYPLCTAKADIVTTSHNHGDHNFIASVGGEPTRLNRAGIFTFDDLVVRGYHSYHDAEKGTRRGENIVYVFESDELRIAHLGDIGHEPDLKLYAALTDIDVLLIPIGGFFTIDAETALRIVDEVRPKLVIPMHYKTPAINFPIDDEKKFAEALGAKYWESSSIELTEDNISKYPNAIIMKYAD